MFEDLEQNGILFMDNCYAEHTEDWCLKLLFDSAFFWE